MADLFDEWSSGIKLAGHNEYFEEIPGDLSNPAEFTVDRDQIPDNPVNPVDPANPTPQIPALEEEPEPEQGPEVIDIPGGGQVILEKTSKGWKATLVSKYPNTPEENFYGNNWRTLVLNLAKGKQEASEVIRKLKKEKMLGGDEPVHTPIVVKNITPKATTLTADQIYEIKNKLEENPGDAFDAYLKSKFGLDPDEFAEALAAAPAAKRIAESQRIAAEVKEVTDDFVRNNPEYIQKYASEQNSRILIQRLAKVYLKKTISKSTKVNVDDVIAELFEKGFWTEENLETAKDELIESGLLEPVNNLPASPKQEPQPVATSPTEPTKHIAKPLGQPAGLGIPVRSSTPTVVPEEKPLSDKDLYDMPLEKLRQIGLAQLRSQRTA